MKLGDIREAWAIAATKPRGTGLRVVHFEGSGSRIWASITPDGHRGVLVAVDSTELLGSTINNLQRVGSALGAEIYHFTYDGTELRGLHLWCKSGEILEAFAGFCEPFLLRIRAGDHVADALMVCLQEFKRLVAGGADADRGRSIVGLVGELYVLSELVKKQPAATAYWFYPDLERHDFRNGRAAVEVKTSLRSEHSSPTITVSAIDQLEPPDRGLLYLHWQRFERDPAGPISVASLLDLITDLVPARDQTALKQRVLGNDGIRAPHQERFALQERRCYKVLNAFPRLTTTRLSMGRLDAGISRVTYELDLSAAAAFQCSPEEAHGQLLAGGAGT